MFFHLICLLSLDLFAVSFSAALRLLSLRLLPSPFLSCRLSASTSVSPPSLDLCWPQRSYGSVGSRGPFTPHHCAALPLCNSGHSSWSCSRASVLLDVQEQTKARRDKYMLAQAPMKEAFSAQLARSTSIAPAAANALSRASSNASAVSASSAEEREDRRIRFGLEAVSERHVTSLACRLSLLRSDCVVCMNLLCLSMLQALQGVEASLLPAVPEHQPPSRLESDPILIEALRSHPMNQEEKVSDGKRQSGSELQRSYVCSTDSPSFICVLSCRQAPRAQKNSSRARRPRSL